MYKWRDKVFLTIGEKIKEIRKIYNLKQNAFSSHGISQNYISMIEMEKRQPTFEMIDQIYDACYVLTKGKVQAQYDKETFRRPPSEQVEHYLNLCCANQDIWDHYENSLKLAQKYNLVKALYRLNTEIGEYCYLVLLNEEQSTHYYLLALQYAIQLNEGIELVYTNLGRNMQWVMNNKQALIYYNLAVEVTVDKNSLNYYRLLLNISLIHIELDEFQNAIEVCDYIITHCENQDLCTSVMITRHYLYTQINDFEKAKQDYDTYLERNYNIDYLGYIYHNEAYALMMNERNDEALIVIEKAFVFLKKVDEISSLIFLKGEILLNLGDYLESLTCFHQSKKSLVNSKDQRQIKEWYTKCLEVYFILNDDEKIKNLFVEMRKLNLANWFPTDILNEMKIKGMAYCLEKMMLQEQQIALSRFILEV